jgi:predicted MPP superfamily phosphohydrolase
MSMGHRLLSASAAIGASCVAYGVVVEQRWFRRRDVVLQGALHRGRPLRILHIADTHLTPPDRRMARFIRQLAEEIEVDLVVASGDLLGAVGSEDATVELLAPLTADGTPGLVVLGSNDLFGPTPKSPLLYFSDPDARRIGQPLQTDRFVAGLEGTGWTVVRNGWTSVVAGGRTIAVSGMDDPHMPSHVLPDVETLLPDIDGVDLHLGLVHAPYVEAVDRLLEIGCRLVLSGHTHGGQVRIPGIGALIGNCDLPLTQLRGATRRGDAWLHVTPGLGQSTYAPFRFGCRPEASVLHLTT